MEIIRVEKSEEVMARINKYMPVQVPPEKVPPCFSDPWDYSGLCNPFKLLPAPSEEHRVPKNCDLHRPCFVYCMEGIGIKNAEQLEKENKEAFFKFCEEKLSGTTPTQIDAAQAVEPPAETPPPVQASEPPPVSAPPVETPPKEQTQTFIEFQCEKCLTIFKVNPRAFDGVLRCPDHREDVEVAPIEEPVSQMPPVEQPPPIDNPPKESAQNEEVQTIPFRKSSAAWQIWIMLLEPKSGEELNELIKGKNFYYFKKFIPKVIEAAKEKGVLEEKDGKYWIVGAWDTTPGRRKKNAVKNDAS